MASALDLARKAVALNIPVSDFPHQARGVSIGLATTTKDAQQVSGGVASSSHVGEVHSLVQVQKDSNRGITGDSPGRESGRPSEKEGTQHLL